MLIAFVALTIGWSAPTEAAKRPITFVADPALSEGRAENFREVFVDPRRIKRMLQPIGDGGSAGAGAKVTGDAIEISDRVFFASDGHTVKPSSLRILDAVADVMKKRPDIGSVEIRGFASDLGSTEANLAVSVRRTKAVVDYLVSKGVSSDRLASVGFGDTKPDVKGHPLQFRIQQWKDVPGMKEVASMDTKPDTDAPKTGSLIISNEAQTSAVVTVNGTKVGVVGPYTDAALHGLNSGVYDVGFTQLTGYTYYRAVRTQPRDGPIVPGGARAVESLPNKGLPAPADAANDATQ